LEPWATTIKFWNIVTKIKIMKKHMWWQNCGFTLWNSLQW
jgi:hypothetical protein